MHCEACQQCYQDHFQACLAYCKHGCQDTAVPCDHICRYPLTVSFYQKVGPRSPKFRFKSVLKAESTARRSTEPKTEQAQLHEDYCEEKMSEEECKARRRGFTRGSEFAVCSGPLL